MSNDQPTRQPPTEPGDWEFTRESDHQAFRCFLYLDHHTPLRHSGKPSHLTVRTGCGTYQRYLHEMPPGYWRRSPPLEPFAPVLPVVELWGEYVAITKDGQTLLFNENGLFARFIEGSGKRVVPTVKRTHTCDWRPCDE